MESLVALAVSNWKTKLDDDFADRLSHRYTCILLITFATIVTGKQYAGEPITCWMPKEFSGSHSKYTNNICWVNNTYYLPFSKRIPQRPHDHRDYIEYYQWAPFVFLFQAMCFYFPTIVWHGLNSRAGIDSDDILISATKLQDSQQSGERKKFLDLIVQQIHRFLHSRQGIRQAERNPSRFTGCGKRIGGYLCLLYSISKMLYLGNAILQMFILKMIFWTEPTNPFSFNLSEWISSNVGEKEHQNFPKVTLCDFEIRALGNVRRYTVQCLLPINLYMQVIYTILWVWMTFLVVVIFLNLCIWLIRFACRSDRRQFIANHLVDARRLDDDDNHSRTLDDFLDDYLKQDGAFILRLIAHNTNNISTTEITANLWNNWRTLRCRRRPPPYTSIEMVGPSSTPSTPVYSLHGTPIVEASPFTIEKPPITDFCNSTTNSTANLVDESVL
ncbi:hypothetical protein CAPTEDRAFT_165053 [Capitella teleta]|uniref:Innexin n=1 Tax=Capitella teleta TaxID=283909 RepID=R7TDU4_CAPTE|nr:hypothetical protein CAPTEDRAFT_165053 [Capitella teleta]|eukprot:ELT91918.1 hypothetical protein CAPTEDRAFT_165053 [Capitella teleta]